MTEVKKLIMHGEESKQNEVNTLSLAKSLLEHNSPRKSSYGHMLSDKMHHN